MTPCPWAPRSRVGRKRPRQQQRERWRSAGPASWMLALLGGARAIQPLLSGLKALQARDSCRQIDVLPFWVEAGRLQFVRPAEKFVDKTRDTKIARRAGTPVERSENRGHRNGGDPLAFDKVRIIRRLKIRGEIVIFEVRAVFDRQKFETFLPFAFDERVDRLRSHKDDACNLSTLHLLKRYRVRDKHLVDIDAEAAENQGTGIGGGGALRIEVDFLARQIRQRSDLRPNEDVQFGRKQIQQISKALLNLRHLRLVLFKRVAVDDGRINPPEIQQVVYVLSRAAGYDGKNVYYAAVVHDSSDVCREMDGRTLQKATGQTYRPGIDPLSYLPLGQDCWRLRVILLSPDL